MTMRGHTHGGAGLYLTKVTWSSYIQGCSSRGGYFPNGGTMRLKTSAMQTNTAGRTICKTVSQLTQMHNERKVRRGHAVVTAYLSEEALPGAPGIQETFPHEGDKLLPPQTPAVHLKRTFTVRALQPVRLSAVCSTDGTEDRGDGSPESAELSDQQEANVSIIEAAAQLWQSGQLALCHTEQSSVC